MNPRLPCATLLLLLCTTGCDDPDGASVPDLLEEAGDRMIVNGHAPAMPEHFVVVSLHTNLGHGQFSDFRCSGVQIFDNWVLTAAHCVAGAQGPDSNDLGVHFGNDSHDLSQDVFLSDGVFEHPQYQFPDNDIALIRLSEPVSYLGHPPVMPLPDSIGLELADLGELVNVAGFGTQEDSVGLGHLAQVDVPLVVMGPVTFETDSQNEGPCFGDSGGAAFWVVDGTPFVAGTTSYVRAEIQGDGVCGDYGGFTKVQAFQGWIEAVTGQAIVAPASPRHLSR